MQHFPAVFAALLAALVVDRAVAKSTSHGATKPTGTVAPCAQVSSIWQANQNTDGSEEKRTSVPASLAHECLTSVPLQSHNAIRLLDTLRPYLEWQSNAAYLADPPRDYYYPACDIFTNLDTLKNNIKSNKYANEYDFQVDLYKTVFLGAHDGHYIYYPDALTIFEFDRPSQFSLVSISEDGASLPVIKLYSEVLSNAKRASAVTHINGIEAHKYVQSIADASGISQDADAAYTAMFVTGLDILATGLFVTGGRDTPYYNEPTTTLTFANGSSITAENTAKFSRSFANVTDGASFYDAFCIPRDADGNPVNITDKDLGYAPPTYPDPVVGQEDDESVNGYYLSSPGLNDVAVLSVLDFDSDAVTFQQTIQDFLSRAKADGKKKLVIDLQGNPGGLVLLGYELFRQIFPHIVQDGYSREKENYGFNTLAELFSAEVAGLNPYNTTDFAKLADWVTPFNYRTDLNILNEEFPTFEARFSPQIFKGTNYTSIIRYNLSDPLSTSDPNSGIGIEISGYGSRTNLTQHFAAENIVLVYDGSCASTCTIFSEMMRIQGGVKSIALGGRPNTRPIQGIGGTKGSLVLLFGDIYYFIDRAKRLTTDHRTLSNLKKYSVYPFYRGNGGSVNAQDQILRHNVKDGLPAQFVREEADCRLFWTEAMIANVTGVWEAAAHAAFRGAKCVHGGFGGKTEAELMQLVGTGVAHLQTSPRLARRESSGRKYLQRSRQWLARHRVRVFGGPGTRKTRKAQRVLRD